jgi:hypothetical protein
MNPKARTHLASVILAATVAGTSALVAPTPSAEACYRATFTRKPLCLKPCSGHNSGRDLCDITPIGGGEYTCTIYGAKCPTSANW